VPAGTGFQTAVFTDSELGTDELALITVRPYERKPDTVAARLASLPLTLAHSILGQRFQMIANDEETPIQYGYASRSTWFNDIDFGVIALVPLEGLWQESVALLEQEFRRARLYGFAQSELSEVQASILNSYEYLVESASTRESPGLADELTATVNGHSVFTSPEEDLRIIQNGLAEMTPDLLHEAFMSFWNTTDLNLILSTKEDAPENTTDVLALLYAESMAVNVTPPMNASNLPFAYTYFGPPGSIVSNVTQEDLQIHQLVLSNNVRVNFKQTDFEDSSVYLVATFGTGKLGQPMNKTGLDSFAGAVMNNGGLGNHSNEELSSILAGQSVGVGFSLRDNAFAFVGSTTPDDLELELQLMAAFLSDPGYRDEAVRQFRQTIPATLTEQKNTINGAFGKMDEWLRGGDDRFAVPTEANLLALEAADVKDWIHPQLSGSYLEVSIAGDFDAETTIPWVLNTFGALPMRANEPDTNVFRDITIPEAPQNNTFTYESKISNAAAVVAWEIPPQNQNSINETRKLSILADVLSNRMWLAIRENLGASYTAYATSNPSDDAFDYGILSGLSYCSPEDSEMVGNLIIEIAANLTENGASQDEIDRALEPTLVSLEDGLLSNEYWLFTVMDECQAKPYTLDYSRTRSTVYESITLQDINDLAIKYLTADKALRVELIPVGDDEGDNSTSNTTRSLLRGTW